MGDPGERTTKQLKSNQKKWWQSDHKSNERPPHPQAGQPCPKCLLADLDLDTLFRLSCPNCGYVAECGAFT